MSEVPMAFKGRLMTDVSSHVEAETAGSCCPLCDGEIREWEPSTLVTFHGVKGLAHWLCLDALEGQ